VYNPLPSDGAQVTDGYYVHTGDCKIIGNPATVFNDFPVVNWYKNSLKLGTDDPLLDSQIAVITFLGGESSVFESDFLYFDQE
jgi:hypothetical protein